MNSQIALLGEAAVTPLFSTWINLAFFETDITMGYLKMAPKLS